MFDVLGIDRIPRARRINTKNKQIISIEKMSVDDEDLREGPRTGNLPLGTIFKNPKTRIASKTLELTLN